MKIFFCLSSLLLAWMPVHLWAFEWHYEGRFRANSQILFDPPPADLSRFDYEVESRNGLVGTLFEKDGHMFDKIQFDVEGPAKYFFQRILKR